MIKNLIGPFAAKSLAVVTFCLLGAAAAHAQYMPFMPPPPPVTSPGIGTIVGAAMQSFSLQCQADDAIAAMNEAMAMINDPDNGLISAINTANAGMYFKKRDALDRQNLMLAVPNLDPSRADVQLATTTYNEAVTYLQLAQYSSYTGKAIFFQGMAEVYLATTWGYNRSDYQGAIDHANNAYQFFVAPYNSAASYLFASMTNYSMASMKFALSITLAQAAIDAPSITTMPMP